MPNENPIIQIYGYISKNLVIKVSRNEIKI